jgi:hypothetical protein
MRKSYQLLINTKMRKFRTELNTDRIIEIATSKKPSVYLIARSLMKLTASIAYLQEEEKRLKKVYNQLRR